MAGRHAQNAGTNVLNYFREDLPLLGRRLYHRSFATKTRAEMEASAAMESKNELKRVLGLPLLIFICLGQIIGAGIFVLTGKAARVNAGPAVIISYAISAIMAFLSALTFVEMAVDYPLAGSSFNYTLAVLGEYPAFITVTAFVVDSILSGGAVARSWSSYLAVLVRSSVNDLIEGRIRSLSGRILVAAMQCGKPSSFFKIPHGGYDLDVVAMAITILVTILVAYGTRESASFNLVFKGTTITLIILVLCLSYPHAHKSNLENFFPYHDSGVFAGAAVVFFAYNGYNAACNMAEEAKNPSRDLPIAILGSLSVATILYILMALAITMMIPYYLIDVGAPFSAAFRLIPGWHWVAYLVSAGAVCSLFTVLLIQVMITSREFLVMARHSLIPSWLAYVNPWTGTPLRIIIPFGFAKAILALMTSFDILTNLVNVGYLFGAMMVAASVLLRRYLPRGPEATHAGRAAVLVRFWLVVGSSIAFAACYQRHVKWYALLVFAVLWIGTALSFFMLPEVVKPQIFRVPVAPIVCSCAIFGGMFLIASLGAESVYRFLIVLAIVTALYLVYGVHAAAHHDTLLASYTAGKVQDQKVAGAEEGVPPTTETRTQTQPLKKAELTDGSAMDPRPQPRH